MISGLGLLTGTTYIRWGRTTCRYGSALVYKGNNVFHVLLYIQDRPKNRGHFVLRLVTSEILIRSASNLASVKVILGAMR